MLKRSNDSYLQEHQELQTTCTLSTTYQINVANKQFVPPINFQKHIDDLLTDI